MNEKIVSSRYAKAIYSAADEGQQVETVLKDFKYILETISSSKELNNLVESPIVSGEKKLAILSEIFSGSISDLTIEFLRLITDKSRTELIYNIAREYELIYNDKYNIIPVLVETAVPLDEEGKKKTTEMLSNWTKATIQAEYKINPDLKGGLKINIDGWVFDATIKNQLEKLRKSLAG
jgi:F-type H+-transporting ATPase subunit delta